VFKLSDFVVAVSSTSIYVPYVTVAVNVHLKVALRGPLDAPEPPVPLSSLSALTRTTHRDARTQLEGPPRPAARRVMMRGRVTRSRSDLGRGDGRGTMVSRHHASRPATSWFRASPGPEASCWRGAFSRPPSWPRAVPKTSPAVTFRFGSLSLLGLPIGNCGRSMRARCEVRETQFSKEFQV
jgi:hypothetical protein